MNEKDTPQGKVTIGGACLSVSPVTGKRCLKEPIHPLTEETVIHQNGAVTWGPGVPNGTENHDIRVDIRPAPGMTSFADSLQRKLRDAFPSFPLYAEDRFQGDGPVTASPEHQLAEWWRQCADDEIAKTVPKAVEYGSTDLIDIGRNVARLSGRKVDDRQAAELGVFFYLEGKFARWRSAIMEDRDVSEDTLFDIGVYVRMAQRIREFGGWPGTQLPVMPEAERTYQQQMFGDPEFPPPCVGCAYDHHTPPTTKAKKSKKKGRK